MVVLPGGLIVGIISTGERFVMEWSCILCTGKTDGLPLPDTGRAMVSLITEAKMRDSILSAARELGWLAYATHDSRRSEPGFPDLVLVKPPRVIFAELKTEKGRIRKGKWNRGKTRWLPGQDDWLNALLECPGVEPCLVRPAGLEDFYKLLIEAPPGFIVRRL